MKKIYIPIIVDVPSAFDLTVEVDNDTAEELVERLKNGENIGEVFYELGINDYELNKVDEGDWDLTDASVETDMLDMTD